MSFSNILGQDLAVGLFKKAVLEKKLAHAYLLIGPDGIGKRSLAKEVAKALNCKGSPEENWPCDLCRECRLIDRDQYPDVTLLKPENKVLKIEAIRQLQKSVALKPYESQVRIAMIENIDQLTPDAAHAFLKTLEEPPLGVYFFLTTEHRDRIFFTIQSRCQMIYLRAIPKEILQQKKFPIPVIHLAQGSFGSAYHWMQDEVGKRRREVLEGFFTAGSIFLEKSAESKEEEKALLIERILLLQSLLRDVLVWKKTQNESLMIHLDYQDSIKKFSNQLASESLKDVISKLDQLAQALDQNANLKLVQSVLELKIQDLRSAKSYS